MGFSPGARMVTRSRSPHLMMPDHHFDSYVAQQEAPPDRNLLENKHESCCLPPIRRPRCRPCGADRRPGTESRRDPHPGSCDHGERSRPPIALPGHPGRSDPPELARAGILPPPAAGARDGRLRSRREDRRRRAGVRAGRRGGGHAWQPLRGPCRIRHREGHRRRGSQAAQPGLRRGSQPHLRRSHGTGVPQPGDRSGRHHRPCQRGVRGGRFRVRADRQRGGCARDGRLQRREPRARHRSRRAANDRLRTLRTSPRTTPPTT